MSKMSETLKRIEEEAKNYAHTRGEENSFIAGAKFERNKVLDEAIEKIKSLKEDTLTEQTIKELIGYAGSYVGIGSYRPTNNGLFGRFELIEFSEVKSGEVGQSTVR